MPVKMQPTSVIKTRLGIESGGRVHKFFTNTCARHMDKYVPFDEGTLAGTIEVSTKTITYIQPYAEIVYYGIRDGKPITIHTDKHKYATTHWDVKMWSIEKDKVIEEVQDYIRRGN